MGFDVGHCPTKVDVQSTSMLPNCLASFSGTTLKATQVIIFPPMTTLSSSFLQNLNFGLVMSSKRIQPFGIRSSVTNCPPSPKMAPLNRNFLSLQVKHSSIELTERSARKLSISNNIRCGHFTISALSNHDPAQKFVTLGDGVKGLGFESKNCHGTRN